MVIWLYIIIIEAILTKFLYINEIVGQDAYDVIFLFLNFIIINLLMLKEKIPRWLSLAFFIYLFMSFLWISLMYFDVEYTVNLFKQNDVLETFHPQAEFISETGYTEGGQFYSICVAFIYYMFGISIRIPVFFNVIATMFSVLYVYRVFGLLEIEKHIKKMFTLIFLFIPWKMLMSLYMMRESIPTLLVVLELYYFTKFFMNGDLKNRIAAFSFGGLAMLFHSGLFVILVVLSFCMLFYTPKNRKFSVTKNTLYSIILLSMLSSVAIGIWGDYLISKFLIVEIQDEAIQKWSVFWTEYMNTGSRYLTSWQYQGIKDVIIQSPVRLLYFLYAPMPWDWRGIRDILAFSIESGIQISLLLLTVRNWKYMSRTKKQYVKILMIAFLLTGLLFGIATFEAGTAMRHREKFMVLILVTAGLSYDCKRLGMKYEEK